MRGQRFFFLMAVVGIGGFSLVGCGLFGGGKHGEPVDFVGEVKPIFEHRCLECHSRKDPKGGLNFQDREVVMKTYRSGSKLVEPGSAKKSLLYTAVSRPGGHANVMPADGWKLTEGQLGVLRRWIDQGAEWPEGAEGEMRFRGMIVKMDEAP